MNGLANAECLFERQREDEMIAALFGDDGDVAADWEPMSCDAVTDSEIEYWIEAFADSGDLEDELGGWSSHDGTPLHAIARQWVVDRDAVGMIIGPSFWQWAKACASLTQTGSCNCRQPVPVPSSGQGAA
jgi:hypothetical protein